MLGKKALKLEKEINVIVDDWGEKEKKLRHEILELLYPKVIEYYKLTETKLKRSKMIVRLGLEKRYFTFYRIIKIYKFLNENKEVEQILKDNKMGYKHIGVIPFIFLEKQKEKVIVALKQGLSTEQLKELFKGDKNNIDFVRYNRKQLFHKLKYKFLTINRITNRIKKLHVVDTKLSKFNLRKYNQRTVFDKYLKMRVKEINEHHNFFESQEAKVQEVVNTLFDDLDKPLYVPNGNYKYDDKTEVIRFFRYLRIIEGMYNIDFNKLDLKSKGSYLTKLREHIALSNKILEKYTS